MRWIPALIGALSFLSALPIAAQMPRPIAASVTGPILEASRNFIMIAGPEGTAGVDTSGALLRVDDQISPRFRGLNTLTATGIRTSTTDPLMAREVVLHLPAAQHARFGGILKEVRKQQCRYNLARLETSRKA